VKARSAYPSNCRNSWKRSGAWGWCWCRRASCGVSTVSVAGDSPAALSVGRVVPRLRNMTMERPSLTVSSSESWIGSSTATGSKTANRSSSTSPTPGWWPTSNVNSAPTSWWSLTKPYPTRTRLMTPRHRHQRDRLVNLGRAVRDITAQVPTDAGSGAPAAWGRSILRLRDAWPTRSPSGNSPPEPGGRPAEATTADSQTPVLPVLDICAHLMCNRLGISMLEESYLRYLAGAGRGWSGRVRDWTSIHVYYYQAGSAATQEIR
jgi:hypothetical protein